MVADGQALVSMADPCSRECTLLCSCGDVQLIDSQPRCRGRAGQPGLLPTSFGDDRVALFLEEDHIISPDGLLALRAMQKISCPGIEPGCFGLCLGSRSPVQPDSANSDLPKQLRRTYGFHNTGYAFSRSVWRLVEASETDFWDAKGYGWDWSMWRLMQLRRGTGNGSLTALPRTMLVPSLSRIHNAGKKGGATLSGVAGDPLAIKFQLNLND
eukprot:SAG31_NODE_1034_length_10228_cov_89.107316_11_plen_213_part_00